MQFDRPTQTEHRLPRCRSYSTRVHHPPSQDLERSGQFGPGQVGPEAVMQPTAEGQDRGRSLARDVEGVGMVVDLGIAVRGKGVDEDEGACRKEVVAVRRVLL